MLMTIFYVNLSRPSAVESPLLIQDRCIPVGQARTSHILLDNLALSNSIYLIILKCFTKSVSSVHYISPNHLSLPFPIIKLTGVSSFLCPTTVHY